MDELNDPNRLIRLDTLKNVLGNSLVGRMRDRNDDGALFFQRELETQLARQYRAERAEHQFANGGLVPIRGTVSARDGEIGFYYMYDHAGIAKWHTSGGVDDIPRVSLKRWRQDFQVHRMALGWGEDMDDIARAEESGFPIQFIELSATFDGLDRKLDNVIFEGDASKSLFGITNHPNITVQDAPAGVGGAIRWDTTGATAKTFEEMVADVETGFATMRAVNREIHEPNQVWMSTNFWSQAGSTFRGTTDMTVQQHLMQKYPGVQFRAVRRLNNAGQFSSPVIMYVKFVQEDELWAEVPGNKIPGVTKVEDERIEGYNKTFTAGVVTPYPLRILRQDFDSP